MRVTARSFASMTALVPTGSTARFVGSVLGAVTLVVVLAFVAVFSIHRITPVDDWKVLFDIGGEANIPTWWNVTLLVMVAIAALVAGEIIQEHRRETRRAWWVVAAAATYASVDEAAGLHERLAEPVQDAEIDTPTYAWLLPGAVLALAGALVLVIAGRQLPQPTASRLGVALASYGTAAVGIEAINGWIVDRFDDSILYTIGTIIEETVEMGACAYAVAAIIDTFQWSRTTTGVSVDRR
jgi:hypothetical protein